MAGKILPEAGLNKKEAFTDTSQSISQLKNNQKVKNLHQQVLDLVDSRTNVNNFHKTMSFVEMLKYRLIEEDNVKLINSSVFKKFITKNIHEEERDQLDTNPHVRIKKLTKTEEGTSFHSQKFSEAYRKIKLASLLPGGSDIKKLINFYFVEILRSDFEG